MSEAPGSSHWDPHQYLRFADHRLRPAMELLQRIPLDSPRLVVDLGCGAGNVTRLLAARWPASRIVGIDHSPDMLDRARADGCDITWCEDDIAAWAPDDSPDLVFSNAALHWLDDHDQLVRRLVSYLAGGGCLAVQMPRSWGLQSHRLMREILAEQNAPAALQQQLARDPVLPPAAYHELLVGMARDLDIWETDYLQVLEGEDAVLEWVRGAGLRPVLAGLDAGARAAFLASYRDRLRAAYPVDDDGRTLYRFRRLFLVARLNPGTRTPAARTR